jgi:hypothetical protein
VNADDLVQDAGAVAGLPRVTAHPLDLLCLPGVEAVVAGKRELSFVGRIGLRVAAGKLCSADGSGAAGDPITDDARDHHFLVSSRLGPSGTDPFGIGDGSGMGDAGGIGDAGGNPERGAGIGD